MTTGRVMVEITKGLIVKDSFAASHMLKDYQGECANLHGHTWHVEAIFLYHKSEKPCYNDDMESYYARLSGDDLGNTCMSVDFKQLKNAVHMVLPDHTHLNALYKSDNVTAEYLSNILFREIDKCVKQVFTGRVWLERLTVYESDKAGAFVMVHNKEES